MLLLLLTTGIIAWITPGFADDVKKWQIGADVHIVTAVENPPFVMKNENAPRGFEGFSVDLLDFIAKRLNFDYKIKLAPDGRYGFTDGNNWNGMVGEIINGRANLTMGDMTVTSDRIRVMDFSWPFMAYQREILIKKPQLRHSTNLLYFLQPFTIEVWLLIIVSFVTVSVCLTMLNHVNPYEWRSRLKRSDVIDPEGRSESFGFKESLWFAASTLTFQGYTKRPLSIAGRTMVVFWCSFCVITVLSYLSILMGLMTPAVEMQSLPFTNLKEASKQSEVDIGMISGGTTMNLFRDSRKPEYERIWNRISRQSPTPFVVSIDEGVERVKMGNYIFITESFTIDYIIKRECELTKMSLSQDSIDFQSYAIGMPIRWGGKDTFDVTIVELVENGLTDMLYEKWWKNTGTCPPTPKAEPQTMAFAPNAISLDQFGGTLVFLLIGIIVAVIVAVMEIVYYKLKNKGSSQRRENKTDNLEEEAGERP